MSISSVSQSGWTQITGVTSNLNFQVLRSKIVLVVIDGVAEPTYAPNRAMGEIGQGEVLTVHTAGDILNFDFNDGELAGKTIWFGCEIPTGNAAISLINIT